MERAIDDYAISGVETTLGFCRYVMGHETFRSGKYDTHFVRDHFTAENLLGTDPEASIAAALVAGILEQDRVSKPVSSSNGGHFPSSWKLARR